jgi:hypothetical protein
LAPRHTLIDGGTGLPLYKLKLAICIAKAPDADFERQVESEKPPTITVSAAIEYAPTPVSLRAPLYSLR